MPFFRNLTLAALLTLPLAAAPTEKNVPYGQHERQVLDFYKAKSSLGSRNT